MTETDTTVIDALAAVIEDDVDPEVEPEVEPEIEPEDDPEDDPEDEPLPAVARSEVDIERAMGQLEKEADRHAKRVGQIMGDDVTELELCPRCAPNVPGFYFRGAPVDDEQKRAVLTAIGELVNPEYSDSEIARTCPTCGGFGRQRSGSKVPGQELVQCPTCPNGRGWVGDVPQPLSRAPEMAAAGAQEPQAVAELPSDLDPWQRRPGDPNYGIMPGYERA